MAVIGFSDKPEHTWGVAGWVLRELLDDVVAQFPEEKAMAEEFEEAKTLYNALIVPRLEPAFAAKVTNAIRQVAEGILSGAIRSGIHDKPYGDATRVQAYRRALQKLLDAIPSTAQSTNC